MWEPRTKIVLDQNIGGGVILIISYQVIAATITANYWWLALVLIEARLDSFWTGCNFSPNVHEV